MSDPDTSDDVEMERLFRKLVQTLIKHMDDEEADILTRTELHGQALPELASHIGCTQAEASRRLGHAQRCLCRHLVLTLASLNSE